MSPWLKEFMRRRALGRMGLGFIPHLIFGGGAPRPIKVNGKNVNDVRMLLTSESPIVSALRKRIPFVDKHWIDFSDLGNTAFVDDLERTMGNRSIIFSSYPGVRYEEGMPTSMLNRLVSPRTISRGMDKMVEYRRFGPKFMPESIVLHDDIFGVGNKKITPELVGKITEQLSGRYPDGFVVKALSGANTLTSQGQDLFLDGNLAGLKGQYTSSFLAQPKLKTRTSWSNYIAQKLLDANPNASWAKGLGDALISLPKNQEFRVHLYNGKVIPHASAMKSIAGPLTQLFLPRRLSGIHGAEKFAQTVADSTKSKVKDSNTMYGYDVARLSDGSYKLIESNPATLDAYSGYPEGSPLVISAITNALRGRTPDWVVARRAALTSGGLGAAGSAVKHMLGNNHDNETTK